MTQKEFELCRSAYLKYGKLSEAYIMTKLKITFNRAQELIKSFFHYIDNNSKWRNVKSFTV